MSDISRRPAGDVGACLPEGILLFPEDPSANNNHHVWVLRRTPRLCDCLGHPLHPGLRRSATLTDTSSTSNQAEDTRS